jgi:hypothetical protein
MTKYFCDSCEKEVPKIVFCKIDYLLKDVRSGGFSLELCSECSQLAFKAIHSVLSACRSHGICPDCENWDSRKESKG